MTTRIAVAGATRIGRRHACAGTENQDSFQYKLLHDGQSLIAAVSDGAGSSSHSLHASQAAVLVSVKTARQCMEEGQSIEAALRAGLQAATDEVLRMADQDQERKADAYHATLILARFTAETAAAIQVGDGAAVVITGDGPKMLTIPQQGEYANETYFITMPQAPQMIFYNETSAALGLAIFTDGLQNQAIDFAMRKPQEDFIQAAINEAWTTSPGQATRGCNSWTTTRGTGDEDLERWLNSNDVSGHNQDDSTLIVAAVRADDYR